MSRLDLHADRLMDRARQGVLSDSERARLRSHCESCAACRIELLWIEDELHAARPTAADRALGAAAVDALLGRAPLQDEPVRESRPVPRRRGRGGAFQIAAGALGALLAASAAAALYTGVQQWRAREAIEAAPPAPAAEAADKPRSGRKGRKPARGAASTPLAIPDPIPTLTPDPVPDPVLVPDRVPVPNPNPVPSPSLSPSLSPSPSLSLRQAPGRPAAEARAATAEAADALFARANAERAAGEHQRAEASYAALAREYPGTRSELAARISHGNLLLRRLEQPAQALRAFASYLAARPDGPLSEEARVGVAISLQHLGRDREEREAWQSLLERHPGSLHAARARSRLLELPR